MLVELTRMERRYDAVLEVIHGRGRALWAHGLRPHPPGDALHRVADVDGSVVRPIR